MTMRMLAISMMALAITACGPSKTELAKQVARQEVKDTALAMASETITGPDANDKERHINEVLRDADLTLQEVPFERSTLNYYIRSAYERDAMATLRVLRDKKAEPETSKTVADQFLREQKLSGKTFAEFGTSPAELTRIITRNGLEHIVKNGGKPTVEQYRAAGLPVPTITKTVVRTVRVPAQSRAPQTARRTTPTRPVARQATRPRT